MKTNFSKLFLALGVMTFLHACKKEDAAPTFLAEQTAIDVAYQSASTQQKMDVYLPAGRDTAKTYTVVMIHGGSWSGGDKADFNTDIPNLKPLLSNYAIFNLNYRLANGTSVLLQQQLADIDSAISFIVRKGAEYNINTRKMAIMGASAGAHLALMKAYKYNQDSRIKAVVDLFGPNDLTWMYNNHPYPTVTQPILVNLMGVPQPQNTTIYNAGSPINFVTALAPPTIIFHGTADPIVPISESVNLVAKLNSFNINNNYITYTGEGHGWSGTNLNDTYVKATAFIKLNVK